MAPGHALHATAAPAVVDFSPYWRPAAWATAVVCTDAMVYAHADAHLVLTAAATGNTPCGQLLLRAVLFRLVTGVLVGRGPSDDPTHARVLHQVVRRVVPVR